MYDISFLSSVKKDIKKLDHPVRKVLKDNIFLRIKDDPTIGEILVGSLINVYSYHFEHNRIHYRIAYVVRKNTIYVLMIGKRENFYDVLKRRLEDYEL